MTGAPRSITIIARGGNDFDVHEGERYAHRLTWDEMLGVVAELTHPAIGGARMRFETVDQHADRASRLRHAGMTR